MISGYYHWVMRLLLQGTIRFAAANRQLMTSDGSNQPTLTTTGAGSC